MLIDRISKSFDGRAVLKDFSLELPKGGTLCLMGRSGCGKTTLLRILLGLETPDSGALRGFEALRMGVVFQEDRLIEHMTALENLRLIAGQNESTLREALCALGLFEDRGGCVAHFSGGQKRRVAIARALLYKPDLLLLDEPFKGLDAETRARAARFIRSSLPKGGTILLIAHDRNEGVLLNAQKFAEMPVL